MQSKGKISAVTKNQQIVAGWKIPERNASHGMTDAASACFLLLGN